MEIREGKLSEAMTCLLLESHHREMLDSSPEGSAHFLDFAELASPDVTFWTAWEDQALLGCGALRQLDPDHGEVKSMRVEKDRLRSGVGTAILQHIMAVARERGYRRLSLETGSGEAFEPARHLYRLFGFTECAAFGDYPADDPFSYFMSRSL